MGNALFRDRMVANIAAMLAAARVVGQVEHQGLKGRLREVFVEHLFRPLLRNGFEATTGVLVDSEGNQSSQIDLIVYSTDILPPFLHLGEQSVVPVEACTHAFEIKSRLTRDELRKCVSTGKSIQALTHLRSAPRTREDLLRTYLNGPYDPLAPEVPALPPVRPIFNVFAFGSDLAPRGQSESDRLQALVDAEFSSLKRDFPISTLCVVGRGFWLAHPTGAWQEFAATPEYDEVIALVSSFVNMAHIVVDARGVPPFGQYLRRPDPDHDP